MQSNNRKNICEDIFTYTIARTENATEEVCLEVKCPDCGTKNLIRVNRIVYPQENETHTTGKPTILYEPKEITTCKKCITTIAAPKELIKIKEQEDLGRAENQETQDPSATS